MAGAGATSRKKPSRSDALDNISAWDTQEVLCLLRKNGLEECCGALAKRQIDGDELLHLTYGKLTLWKNDLTRPQIGQLWAFVQELNKIPEKYVPDKTIDIQQNNDCLSDDSWGTDFEDEESEENSHLENMQEVAKPSQINNKRMIPQNNIINRIPMQPLQRIIKPEKEETYANCESCQDEENMYMNFQETTPPLPPINVSRLYNQMQKTLVEKEIIQSKEELQHTNNQAMKKPAIRPKPETLAPRKIQTISDQKLPQKSFLYNASNQRIPNEMQRRMAVPPPPEPKRNKDYVSAETKKLDKELPKPPAVIRNLDLVANLPAQTEESEDEYEAFDGNIVEQKKMSRVDSKQSLHSGRQGSVESVYKPPSATSHEEEEEDYELYESITEGPEDNTYLSPIQRTNNATGPPPLPAKPLSPTLSSTLPNRVKSEKSKHTQRKERSPDKKSATLPHASSNNSLANERATRPLPPPPERQSYVDKSWFHNITREQAVNLIKAQGTGGTKQQDGYFLVRPSITQVGNPLTLVLWYKDKVYNIPVRKRNDNRYALGSAKVNESSFMTVEEIVAFYMREELVLHSCGVQTGSTRLTDTPPK